jgi:antitoxin MazE
VVPPPPKLLSKLVPIGNSRGVRLPKAVIEQANLGERVEILVRGNKVILQAAEPENPRAGWEEQIKAALAEHGDDVEDWLDWQNIPNDFDEKEWTW